MQRLIITIWFWLALSLPLFATDFNFASFDVPGARLTRPFGVNARAQIVGLYRDANNKGHGFLLDGDSYYTIDFPGATFTNAIGINARGDIVGRWTDAGGKNHGYLLTGLLVGNPTPTSIDPTAPCTVTALQTVARGINDVGDIVGRCFDGDGNEYGFIRNPVDGTFRIITYPDAVTTDAFMITDAGAIVGDYSDSAGRVHGYLLTPDGQFAAFDFPGVPITSGRWINERGNIAGVYRPSLDDNPQTEPGDQGFLLRGQDFVTVGYPPHGVGIGSLAVNNSGLVVGDYIDDTAGEHGFTAIEVR